MLFLRQASGSLASCRKVSASMPILPFLSFGCCRSDVVDTLERAFLDATMCTSELELLLCTSSHVKSNGLPLSRGAFLRSAAAAG